jgi:membrane-bound lytic murein transglycosylase MltF
MPKVFLSFILSLFIYISNAQNNLLTANTSVIDKNIYVTREITISSNIVYTKYINDLPKETIDWCLEFSKRTNYIKTIHKLGKSYLPKVNKIFGKLNIPTELNMLLPIESYYNKNCVSSVGAVGYWQFMNQTAVEYGLSIDSANDERKDFNKSTKAAARYLKNSYNALHDWYLAAASYNCGVGNVKKAIAKSGKVNPTFFDLKPFLPKETQNYVLKYIALNIIYKNYNLYTAAKMQWCDITKTITEHQEETNFNTVAPTPTIKLYNKK